MAEATGAINGASTIQHVLCVHTVVCTDLSKHVGVFSINWVPGLQNLQILALGRPTENAVQGLFSHLL